LGESFLCIDQFRCKHLVAI